MTHVIETLAAIIVAGWVLHRLIAVVVPRTVSKSWLAAASGYGAMALAGIIGGDGFGIWVSVIAPVGAMLPLLCLASSGRVLNVWTPPRAPRIDKLVLFFLILLVAFSAAGFGPLNLYAHFYEGLGPVLLASGLALWALWRRQVVVLVAVIFAQCLWLLDIGSSNFYDQVSHLALLPALLFSAMRRSKG
ncbi:MAG: hypothetical protein ABJL99_01100 [Aliishimia sp.]